MEPCPRRPGLSSSNSSARTYNPENQTSLPADSRPAFCSRSPLASASRSSSASRPELDWLRPAADDEVIGIVHDVRFPTLLVPEFLPPQHEPSHVQIAEQGTDRRPLWSTSTFVPIARTPTFVPTLVGFLDRSFQPHLDQMQHHSIDDPASHRLQKLGVRNIVKVTAEIRINDLPMTRVDQLVGVLYCVQCAAVRPIGVLLRLQVGLEDRFEYEHGRRLHNPIPDCRYA